MKKKEIERLNEISMKRRLDILESIYKANKGHIGGALSCIDIIVNLYYGGMFKQTINQEEHQKDRFILSKGHAAIALYTVLADLKFFPPKELELLNNESLLSEHPDPSIPGIECISGSLGHGLSIGAGIALGEKYTGRSNKTYVLMGDGECNEGSVWEAMIFAPHHRLKNLCAIVDRNRLITHGDTETINAIEPLGMKCKSFGWDTLEIDGNNHGEIGEAIKYHCQKTNDMPTMLIAKTMKGKGINFMENKAQWHHGGINDKVYEMAKKAIKQSREEQN